GPQRWRRFGRGLRNFVRRSPLSAFWGCIAALIILVAVAAPELAPYPPLKSDFRAMTKPPAVPHYFGTDQIGRDTLSRVIYGSRAVVLSLKEMSYVEAARGLGASHMRMMLRHILPQCIAPYLILATTHLGVAIIIEASLGFLGVGIPPPTPTWGNMLADSLNAG